MSYFPEGWSPAQCIMVVEGRERTCWKIYDGEKLATEGG